MKLSGNSLGARQQDLNFKVNDAAYINVNFDDIEAKIDTCDVDKLFKIDLASKYKNINYIVKILKSGDSLHISRALKFVWLYDDEYSTVINTEYLHDNIFPFMSMKMKKKMLSSIAVHVRSESRAKGFYEYCTTTLDMSQLAAKFVNFTSELFKLDLIENKMHIVDELVKNLQTFFGNSFLLAETFLKKKPVLKRRSYLYDIRYLYSVCNVKYLDLLEKYYGCYYFLENLNNSRFSQKISDSIIIKYKERVTKNVFLYTNVLNVNSLVGHTKVSEAKTYLPDLLPDKPHHFWEIDICKLYAFIINLVPSEERYRLIKQIFEDKYPGEPFEMSLEFFNLKFYNYMTSAEQEAWALDHIKNKTELLGPDKNYLWYKFVNYDTAFTELKKIMLTMPESCQISDIIQVLIKSAKNQRDLEKLFSYYYERHINESMAVKELFLKGIIEQHHREVFKFDASCWTAFNKLLYSIEAYNPLDDNDNYLIKKNFTTIALLYNIIHNKELPDTLKQHPDWLIKIYENPFIHVIEPHLDKMDKAEKEAVYQYFLEFSLNKLNSFEGQTFDLDLQWKIAEIVCFTEQMFMYFQKTKEDFPEILIKYMVFVPEVDLLDEPECDERLLTQGLMLRLLKQDASLVVSKLPCVEYNIAKNRGFKFNQLLRKLKIYFVEDFAKEYLIFFTNLLKTELKLKQRIVYAAVHCVFQLADEKFKHDFMLNYVPSDAKVDHRKINRTLLYIQKAICRYAGYSRPSISLSMMSSYIKVDYLKYCRPLFNHLVSNLPLYECIEFVVLLSDTPVSIQKYGLRLAFKAFDVENLKKLISEAWKITKNVSLRMVIYTYLSNYIQLKDELTQTELFEVFKTIILDLNKDDHEDVISLLTELNIPDHLKGNYLETVWKSVSKFPDNSLNLERKSRVILNIGDNIDLMAKDVVRQIINELINDQLDGKQGTRCDTFENAKRHLVSIYTVRYDSDADSKTTAS